MTPIARILEDEQVQLHEDSMLDADTVDVEAEHAVAEVEAVVGDGEAVGAAAMKVGRVGWRRKTGWWSGSCGS